MKKNDHYAFQLVCICILAFSLFLVLYFQIKIENYHASISNINANKIVSSASLIKSEKKESVKEKENTMTTVEDISPSQSFFNQEKIAVNIVDTSHFAVLKTETVNISHYGHDCSGCTTGLTASGYYVGDGRIYYQDETFGSVRIVAADSKYPLGTILRLGYFDSKVTAIVLDRGGGIGDGKKFQIDLLTSSEKESYQLGVVRNASLEVLRLGY